MPGVGMKCLNTIQLIFGVDLHESIPPPRLPPPAPAPPPMPHIVVWGEGWSQKFGLMWARSNSRAASPETGVPNPVAVCYGYAVGRTHDAGPHLGHFAINILMPFVFLGSGSKSEFASGSVQHGGGDMAIAVGYAINLNLNCGDPVPLPSGVVVAACCTVKAGFTWGDFFGGLFAMLLDMAIAWLSQKVCGWMSEKAAALLIKAYQRLMTGACRGLYGCLMSHAFGQKISTGLLRGSWRGLVSGNTSPASIHFVSQLLPSALVGVLTSGGVQPITKKVIEKTLNSLFGVYVVGSPVGYSSDASDYGQISNPDGKIRYPGRLNEWANALGHSIVGEKP